MGRDKIEKLNNSLIQHGKENDRIYLMKLDVMDVPGIISDLDNLAASNRYTKIFAKVPGLVKNVFIENGYKQEAVIPGFYYGKQDGFFLGKFLSSEREKEKEGNKVEKILEVSKNKSIKVKESFGEEIFEIRKAGPADIAEMSCVYKEVFETYPFPIHDTQFLLETMKAHVQYYVACEGEKIAAVSSAEVDVTSKNAEMTDFATLPEYRGKNLAGCLLTHMESDMRAIDVKITYTIARALSYGINITFSKNNYQFAGTLVNNTNISGQIESMNVWYKALHNKNWMPPHPEMPSAFFDY